MNAAAIDMIRNQIHGTVSNGDRDSTELSHAHQTFQSHEIWAPTSACFAIHLR
jgi:hypothetical protein